MFLRPIWCSRFPPDESHQSTASNASENEKPREIAGFSTASHLFEIFLENVLVNAPVDFSPPFEENTEWKGESRVVTLVVTRSLSGAPEIDQGRIDFFWLCHERGSTLT